MKKLIYIAAPYTHPDKGVMELRFNEACEYAACLFRQEKLCISPVIHCHPIAEKHELPRDFNFWSEYCHELLTMCDELHVLQLDGWKESKGVTAEIQAARALDLKIKYI